MAHGTDVLFEAIRRAKAKIWRREDTIAGSCSYRFHRRKARMMTTRGMCLSNKVLLLLTSFVPSLVLLARTIALHGILLQIRYGDMNSTIHGGIDRIEQPLTLKLDGSLTPIAFASPAEHMARYDPNQTNATSSRWLPSWIGNNNTRRGTMEHVLGDQEKWKAIERDFLTASDNAPPATTRHAKIPLLGFLRIPKTGSTSLLAWAAVASRRGPHFECFLGSKTTDSKHNLFPESFYRQHYLHCPHRTYETTVWHWARRVLPNLIQESVDSGPKTFSLQFFTILRDPFDRLVSYFQYVQRIYPTWSHVSTPEQNATILANNLSGWMELLAAQGSEAFHLPYQKSAMTEADWGAATDDLSVTDEPKRVLVVLQECFEASIWLLTETFPEFFAANETQAFLRSAGTRYNTKSRFQTRNNQRELLQLRQRAQVWFADDFRFYEAAVTQFQARLAASHVDSEVVQECFRTLDTGSRGATIIDQ